MINSHPKTVSLAFLLVALSVTLNSCDMRNLQKEQAELKILNQAVKKEYSQRHWDKRVQAVSRITSYLSGKNKKQILLVQSSPEYSQLVDQLISFSHDVHGAVRIETLKAFSLIRPEKAYPRISEMALNDASGNVQWYALKALALYQNENSAQVFTDKLKSEDWVLREASIIGILMLNIEYQKSNLLPVICNAIEDPNESVSGTALSLVTIREPEIYQSITRVFRKKENFSTKMLTALMRALNGFVLEADIKKRVISCLTHPDKNVRILALRVLKREKALKKLRASSNSKK